MQLLLALTQCRDEIAGHVNRIDRTRCQRGMRLQSATVSAVRTLALVPEHELHVGRLTDHAQKRPYRRQVQHVEQTPHTDTADLFVMGQRQLQWPVQGMVGGIEHGVDSQRDKALHIATATAINPPVLHRRLKRREGPGLARCRYHIGVPGQQNPRHFPWTGTGEQVGFFTGGILDDQRLDALGQQQIAHVLDQGHVRLRRNGVKGHQTLENIQYAGFHEALLRCSTEEANRLMENGKIEVLVLPVLISSAITSPTPGPSWKPWPLKPNA